MHVVVVFQPTHSCMSLVKGFTLGGWCPFSHPHPLQASDVGAKEIQRGNRRTQILLLPHFEAVSCTCQQMTGLVSSPFPYHKAAAPDTLWSEGGDPTVHGPKVFIPKQMISVLWGSFSRV